MSHWIPVRARAKGHDGPTGETQYLNLDLAHTIRTIKPSLKGGSYCIQFYFGSYKNYECFSVDFETESGYYQLLEHVEKYIFNKEKE